MVKTGKQVALIYNHGQKSWDTFAFVELFSIHTYPAPPPPETTLDTSIKNVFRVSTLYRVGEERTARKIRKRMHCLMRAPRNYRKFWIQHYCPKEFRIVVINWFKSLWSSLPLRDKQFSWNYVGHRRYLATIPNHQRNLRRIRNHLKKVKENNKKISNTFWKLRSHDTDHDALIRTV